VATARRNHSIAGQKRALPDPETVSLSEAGQNLRHCAGASTCACADSGALCRSLRWRRHRSLD
jgi:hypothetical protein